MQNKIIKRVIGVLKKNKVKFIFEGNIDRTSIFIKIVPRKLMSRADTTFLKITKDTDTFTDFVIVRTEDDLQNKNLSLMSIGYKSVFVTFNINPGQ